MKDANNLYDMYSEGTRADQRIYCVIDKADSVFVTGSKAMNDTRVSSYSEHRNKEYHILYEGMPETPTTDGNTIAIIGTVSSNMMSDIMKANPGKNIIYIDDYSTISESVDGEMVSTSKQDGGETGENTQTIEQFAEEWSKKEGWSVEYFNKKVLPRIDEAWQIEYELAPDQSVQVALNHTATMNFNYGNSKRSDVNSTSTIEAIKNGERTATTRYESDGYIDFWKNIKKGDVVKFIKRNSKNEIVDEVKVIITKPLTKLVFS